MMYLISKIGKSNVLKKVEKKKSNRSPFPWPSVPVRFGPDMPARCFRLAAVQQGAKGAHLKGRTHREVEEIPSTP